MKDYKNTEDTPVGSNAGISRRDFVMTRLSIVLIVGLFVDSLPASAQGTVSDYARAITLRDRYQGLAINVPEQVQWIRNTNRFWYRKSVRDGTTFVLVDADTQAKAPAFDHTRLAEALSTAMEGSTQRSRSPSPPSPLSTTIARLNSHQVGRRRRRRLVWRKNSTAVTFEYNQRGHQVDRRRSMTSRGRTSRTRGSRIGSSGTRRPRRSIRYYDITRVGIYGTSAGGQNSLGALLFHPEFYKVAVSFAGCHDNRMDKIWWNEQWMGWPIGPEYAESSNVENGTASRVKCCWSLEKWITTSIRPPLCKSSIS